MRAAHLGQHAGRNQNDQERRFVSKPSAPETQAKCKRCKRALQARSASSKNTVARAVVTPPSRRAFAQEAMT